MPSIDVSAAGFDVGVTLLDADEVADVVALIPVIVAVTAAPFALVIVIGETVPVAVDPFDSVAR